MAPTEYNATGSPGTFDGYRLCPQCGNYSHVSEGQSYCGLCGTKLLGACPRCGSAIHYPTARFCPDCGVLMVCGTEAKDVKQEKQRNVVP